MRAIDVLKALGPIDARSVRRDALLRWIVMYPLALALLVRWGAPALALWLAVQFQFDLTIYWALFMSFVLLMVPIFTGIVIGFLLLDQRDDDTLTALQVTPLTLNGYLVYRITVPILLTVAMIMVLIPLAGLVEMGLIPLFFAALEVAPLAPIFALFFATFAKNKVQGFALMKGAGILMYPPMIAYFISSGWQWAFGLFPTYWPVKLFWMLEAGERGAWLCFLIGLAYQFCLLTALLRRFNRVMH